MPILNDNIIIVHQHKYKYEHQKLLEEEDLPLTPEEKHKRAMFEIGNTKTGTDGRTYLYKDDHGRYVSSYVSQYSNIIDDNIEPKIRETCKRLHDKGYLTFGSCQGHSNSKLRWIGLVFNDQEQKQKFIDTVDSFGLDIYWYDNHINTVERPKKPEPWYWDGINVHIVWNSSHLEKASVLDQMDKPYTEKNLTDFWNIQMCRNYDRYESVVMAFGFCTWNKSFFERLKHAFTFNWKHVDFTTKQFNSKISKLDTYIG